MFNASREYFDQISRQNAMPSPHRHVLQTRLTETRSYSSWELSEPPTEPAEETTPHAVPRGLAAAGLLVFAVVVGLTLWTLRAHIGEAIMWLAELAENAGPWGVVATILALAVWVLVPFMPINLFEVVIGYIFPLWTAVLVCVVGKTLGAVGCFALAQQAKPLVARLVRTHSRLRGLERTVRAHPAKATMLVRFSLLPAAVKNYGSGSLGVDFRVFLAAALAEV